MIEFKIHTQAAVFNLQDVIKYKISHSKIKSCMTDNCSINRFGFSFAIIKQPTG